MRYWLLSMLKKDLELMSAKCLDLQEDAVRAEEKARTYAMECDVLEARIDLIEKEE